ncbi:MAG: glycosyltransferase [Candidatus Methanomethyliaceae archaeon]|nr:glycosyltransferase [Candidatus Methanomethyliaceae archaeon]
MVKLSVIIPTYNEEKGIEKTLRSISSQTLPRSDYEIIVVDGGSVDRTVEIASKYADLILQQKSKGVGGARNDGVEVARGRVIVHTDADVIVRSDWLHQILSHFSSGVVAVCGPDEPLEPDPKYRTLYSLINLISLFAYKLGIVWTRGTNTAVLKDAFLKVGGYTDYPLCDDGELGLRLKKIGKVVYSPKISVKMSARRFKKYGILRVIKDWIKGDLMIFMGKRTFGKYHKESY